MYYVRSLQQIVIFISVKSDIRYVLNEKYEFYKAEYRYMRSSVLKRNIVFEQVIHVVQIG
jgi:hypothetical protein